MKVVENVSFEKWLREQYWVGSMICIVCDLLHLKEHHFKVGRGKCYTPESRA